jgi:arylformamidase
MTTQNINMARAGIAGVALALACQISLAGPLGDRFFGHRPMPQQEDMQVDDDVASDMASLPAGVRIVRDVAYGNDAAQRFDIYAPDKAHGVPVIFMVHGGGWRTGDKAISNVVKNKVARWVPKGFIVISANYRMLPGAAPLEQARDVGKALAAAQEGAATWGGDRSKFILMGHSSGAHLVALLAASPRNFTTPGTSPWLGSVLLDTAALDVVDIMQRQHFGLYDAAFGNNPEYWKSVSPIHVLSSAGTPILAVCSTRRADSCSQAMHFAAKASSLGTRVPVLKQPLSHKDVNQQLGEEGSYTDEVEAFMRTLDVKVAKKLR